MKNMFRLSLIALSLVTFASLASARPAPFPGGGGHGPGPRPGPGPNPGGGAVVFNTPMVNGYYIAAGNYVAQSSQQFCRENGYADGQTLGATFIRGAAPSAEFNGSFWQYSPQSDNINAVTSVQCFQRGGGGGNRNPDQTFTTPLLNQYPLLADQATADGYCQSQRYARGTIMQTTYVDTNPAYYFRNGAWNFSPKADHYQMIQLLGCYRF